MPISILPLSRRRFLTTSLAAAAVLVVSRFSLARANTALDPNRIALLSDIHINANPAFTEKGINMTDHLREAVAGVLKTADDSPLPGTVLINGDCAYHTGEAADYEALVNLLSPLSDAGIPIHLAMGNHDRRDRFWKTLPYEKWAATNGSRVKALDQRHVLVIDSPRANWIMLDSLDVTDKTPGLLGDAQLAWLKAELDSPPTKESAKPIIVLSHHHPKFPIATAAATTKPTTAAAATQPWASAVSTAGLTDSQALMDILLPRRQVKALLFGHTHQWWTLQQEGLHLLNLPTVAYPFRPGQPSGWVNCNLAPDSARLTLHCVGKDLRKDADTINLKWRV